MAARRIAAALTVAAGSLAAAAAYRRARAGRRERVDVYFADGSLVSLEPGSPAGDRLLALARRALAAARG